MLKFDYLKTITSREHRKAWLVAIIADAIQIVGMPLFGLGAITPADTVLDLATAAILIKILGWHWAFLPTFAAEMIPGLDLFPTWTTAVFFVTRSQVRTLEPEILAPGATPSAQT